jgi:hypothetical protein
LQKEKLPLLVNMRRSHVAVPANKTLATWQYPLIVVAAEYWWPSHENPSKDFLSRILASPNVTNDMLFFKKDISLVQWCKIFLLKPVSWTKERRLQMKTNKSS